MSDDMENQRAMRIAKEVDPKGVRTIGKGFIYQHQTFPRCVTKSRTSYQGYSQSQTPSQPARRLHSRNGRP